MRTITVAERRALVVRRHHLAGDATTPEQVAAALVGLHATDPASVVLSVLARGHGITVADLLAAMYDRRTLVRWMAMRRTLFVFPRGLVPTIQAAVSAPLSATLRTRLVRMLERNGSDPPIVGDVGDWLVDVEDSVERDLVARATASGVQLSAAEPRLRTAIPPRTPSERPQNVTSQLLAIMGTDGRLVRGTPTGTWTTRQHRWEPIATWWPDGLPELDRRQAQADLVRTYLSAFGPCTVEDVEWWTGWGKRVVAGALATLPVEPVDLHGTPGIALVDDAGSAGAQDADRTPAATLLPALDPTTMGWRHRDWYLRVDRTLITDTMGNVGPTVWWDGEIVGAWAIAPSGEIRTRIVADRGADAAAAVDAAATALQARLDGAVVTPVFRTRLEQTLLA